MRDACPLMIFAAGFGTRMGLLTADRPKPMIEIAGRRMIDRAADIGEAAGCTPIVANTHYMPHVIEPVLAHRGITVSHETHRILDTGGGLKAALSLLGGSRIATLNPDVAWSGVNPLRILLETSWPEEAGALLLVVPEDRALGRTEPGDFALGEDGRLSREGAFIYTGAQLIEAEAVQAIPRDIFSLNTVWSALAEHGRLYGVVYPGHWCDAGNPEGLRAAETLLGESG